MTVKELSKIFSEYPENTEIKATWEGTVKPIEVYLSADGVLLIDADEGFYKDRFQSGEMKADY